MNAFIQELFHFGIYKRTQGRVARQATFAAVAVTVVLGFYRLYQTLLDTTSVGVSIGIPMLLTLLCWWLTYRLVNFPRFADFLIAVEAEMAKVSWPTWTELIRASIVVLVTMAVLAAVLFGFDYFWVLFFRLLRDLLS